MQALTAIAGESCTKTGFLMIFGEISSSQTIDYEQVIRDTVKDIGYDSEDKGFDYKTCEVRVAIEEQSPDIAQGLNLNDHLDNVGGRFHEFCDTGNMPRHFADALLCYEAGDQGLMIGYATDETKYLDNPVDKASLLPVSHLFAHKLTAALTSRREDGSLPWLRYAPDFYTPVRPPHAYQSS